MSTLKMVKTLDKIDFKYNPLISRNIRATLRKEAIKWIKKDLRKVKKQEIGVQEKIIIMCWEWAERFNLTYEDLDNLNEVVDCNSDSMVGVLNEISTKLDKIIELLKQNGGTQ